MTQQSRNSISAFKTSRDLKIIDHLFPFQVVSWPVQDLDPPRAQRPSSCLFHSTEVSSSFSEAPPAGLGSALLCG